MWKIGIHKQISVMSKKEFSKFILGKQVVERTFYHWGSTCEIKKYTRQQALKIDFWFDIHVYSKNYTDNQLKDFYFYPKKRWYVRLNQNRYYITKGN
jgi:hypothetical protein